MRNNIAEPISIASGASCGLCCKFDISYTVSHFRDKPVLSVRLLMMSELVLSEISTVTLCVDEVVECRFMLVVSCTVESSEKWIEKKKNDSKNWEIEGEKYWYNLNSMQIMMENISWKPTLITTFWVSCQFTCTALLANFKSSFVFRTLTFSLFLLMGVFIFKKLFEEIVTHLQVARFRGYLGYNW